MAVVARTECVKLKFEIMKTTWQEKLEEKFFIRLLPPAVVASLQEACASSGVELLLMANENFFVKGNEIEHEIASKEVCGSSGRRCRGVK